MWEVVVRTPNFPLLRIRAWINVLGLWNNVELVARGAFLSDTALSVIGRIDLWYRHLVWHSLFRFYLRVVRAKCICNLWPIPTRQHRHTRYCSGVIVDLWVVITSWFPPSTHTHTNPTVRGKGKGLELQCLLKVKEDLIQYWFSKMPKIYLQLIKIKIVSFFGRSQWYLWPQVQHRYRQFI